MPHPDAIPTLHPTIAVQMAAVQAAVSAAPDLAAEIRALTTGQSDRNAAVLLAVWGLTASAPQSMHAVAATQGITHERVRQLVRRHEQRLRSAGLQLPRLGQTLQTLLGLGGVASTGRWLAAVRATEPAITPALLRVCGALSAIGLAAPLRWETKTRLWQARPSLTAAWPVVDRAAIRRGLVRGAQSLRATGTLTTRRLQQLAPYGVPHLLQLLADHDAERVAGSAEGQAVPPGWFVRTADGWRRAMPTPTLLQKQLRRLLVATGPLPLPEVQEALRSSAQARLALPLETLAAILRDDPLFVWCEDRVALRDPSAAADLRTGLDRVLTDALLAAGGQASAVTLGRALVAAGYGAQSLAWTADAPAIVRLGRGQYGLRGAPGVPLGLGTPLDAPRRPIRLRREGVLVDVLALAPGVWRLVYRVDRRMLKGTIRLPATLGVPDGKYLGRWGRRQAPMTIYDGALSGFRALFRTPPLVAESTVQCVLDVSARTVLFTRRPTAVPGVAAAA